MVELGGGGISYRMVGSAFKNRKMQVVRERYAPGSDTGAVLDQADLEALCTNLTVGLFVFDRFEQRFTYVSESYEAVPGRSGRRLR